MPLINPHINFNGNAEEAFTFYKSVFGGEFATILRFRELPGAGVHITEKEADKIMHIALPIGKNVLMGNDVPESMGRTNENENRSKISVSAESKEEADRLFTDFLQEDKSKCQWQIAPGVPILECSGTNTVSNGWSILTRNIMLSFK